jgi:hypothetical protein
MDWLPGGNLGVTPMKMTWKLIDLVQVPLHVFEATEAFGGLVESLSIRWLFLRAYSPCVFFFFSFCRFSCEGFSEMNVIVVIQIVNDLCKYVLFIV